MSRDEELKARVRKRFEEEMKDFPHGYAEFRNLIQFHLPPVEEIGGRSFGAPMLLYEKALSSAQTYRGMNMYKDALRMYNRAQERPDVLSTDANLWQGFAECHRRLGEWENVQGYILKSVIGNGATATRKAAFRDMEQAMKDGRKAEIPAERPDAGKLEQIILECAEVTLFPDAFEAVTQLKAMGKAPSLETELKLHQSIYFMVMQLKELKCDDVTYRGIEVTAETLKKEDKIVAELRGKIAAQR